MSLLCSFTRSQQSNCCLLCTHLLLRVATCLNKKYYQIRLTILDSKYITHSSNSSFVCLQRVVVERRVIRRRVAPCRLCPHSSGYDSRISNKNKCHPKEKSGNNQTEFFPQQDNLGKTEVDDCHVCAEPCCGHAPSNSYTPSFNSHTSATTFKIP